MAGGSPLIELDMGRLCSVGYAAAVEHADAEAVAELDTYLTTPADELAERHRASRLSALIAAGGEIA